MSRWRHTSLHCSTCSTTSKVLHLAAHCASAMWEERRDSRDMVAEVVRVVRVVRRRKVMVVMVILRSEVMVFWREQVVARLYSRWGP